MKLPSLLIDGTWPSGSSVAFGYFGLCGSRVGGGVFRPTPAVSMKNGAFGSVVLAPAGTDALGGTQAVSAAMAGMAAAVESSAATRTAWPLVICDLLPLWARQPVSIRLVSEPFRTIVEARRQRQV